MKKNSRNDLAKRYNDICKEYLVAFCKNYDLPLDTDDVWVKNDAGTIACIGDYYFDFNDVIKYSVDNGLTDLNNLLQWYDYSLFAIAYNQIIPNFYSWCKGFKGLSEKEQQCIINSRNDLNEEIKD